MGEQRKVTCPICNGRGKVSTRVQRSNGEWEWRDYPCFRCLGSGEVTVS